MTDIESILANMTLEEKAALCTGASSWTTTPIDRLGLPELLVSDGPHGVRRPLQDGLTSKSYPATCFPTASCLASTWDVELIRAMGIALAEECIAQNVGVLLGPGVNMKRSPLGGRNFEYFSEDPFLAGEMAAAWIQGVQSRGVGTSLKHFAANNQEFQRFSISAAVDERTLREIYLPAFEMAVKKGKPWTVMCAYNKLNGFFCSEHNELLTRILKLEWGFEGLVMSDWGAVRNRVKALNAGLDLEMPGPKPSRVQAVVQAVCAGTLDEAVLDESVRRIIRIALRAAQTPKGQSFDSYAHHTLARQIAAEGMVLLKNDGILPLKSLQHIAVIGRAAETPHFQGGGSSHINPTMVSMPFVELQHQACDAELTYAQGYPADDSFEQALIDEAVAIARPAEVALLYIALPAYKESEGYDRADLDLTVQQVALIKAVAAVQPKTVVILNNGAPVVMGEWIKDVSAVLEAWMMGQAGGGAIADILFGAANPSGKLAETFPLRLADTPTFLNFPGENGVVRYSEGMFIGYRYYDAKQIAVQFPFGYGLSYTTFAYSNLTLSSESFRDVDGLIVSLDVTNTGALAGKETVQVYVHDRKCSLQRPVKELKGFAKVELQPGETKTVSIPLDYRAFAFYHTGHQRWITEDGEFDILVGASSADIRCSAVAVLQTTQQLPSLLNEQSTVKEWLEDPRGKLVFEPLFRQMAEHLIESMSGGEEDGEMVGMDVMGFMMDMPLLSVLHFQESALPASPEEMVAGLLGSLM
ncbi:MAG TPA: glycoside hydrolase family 3 C-terminal domain-containing protein [Anaerolineaceae bacterium]|nr:glycoside hydrolase family 3 C-terminal domain-containing protein [Anaerolineaceae bacterium]